MSANENNGTPPVVVGCLMVISMIFGAMVGGLAVGISVENSMRSRATKNNAAYYEIDPKTGETTFTWGDPEENSEE